MGALASGTAAAVGSGAFTTSKADRSLEVSVAADDSQAFLAMDPQDEDRVRTNGDGAIEIDLAQDNTGNSETADTGVNPNGFTDFLNLFTITNQSTNDLVVMIDGATDVQSYEGISIFSAYDTSREHEPGISDNAGSPPPLEYDETEGGANYKIPSNFDPTDYFGEGNDYPVLSPGETLDVGFYFVTESAPSTRLYKDTSLTVAAVAVDSERDKRS